MISANRLLEELVKRDVSLFTGVPCSYLTPLINATLENKDIRYIQSSSEGEALAIAAGAWLAGHIGVVMQQNSGLGNIVNPLTSLSAVFKIPSLLLITWRGEPGKKDEPQHKLMGQITPSLLDLMDIPWAHLPEREKDLSNSIDKAFEHMKLQRTPYAFLIKKEDITVTLGTDSPLSRRGSHRNISSSLYFSNGRLPSRVEVLKTFVDSVSRDSPVVATTGKCGRELFTISDSQNNLYCVGSMGYANAIAHGVALASPRTVYVLDGDGAALMHMGNIATIGATGTQNLVHVLMDNGTYDTTGGQPTVSDSIDFIRVAKACGYRDVSSCTDLDSFRRTLCQENAYGPRFIHIRISEGSLENIGRPTISPDRVAQRFRKFTSNVPTSYQTQNKVKELQVTKNFSEYVTES